MSDLECRFVRLSEKFDAERAIERAASFVPKVFSSASNRAININVENYTDQVVDDPWSTLAGGSHLAADLHSVLGMYVPYDPNTLSNTIAVLFGGYYEHRPSAYGVMFDAGYLPEAAEFSTNNPSVEGHPREGCAVFLGAIEDGRNRDEAASWDDFDEQVLFTTVHEIGHVFNLEHDQASVNFMAQSSGETPYDVDDLDFTEGHKNHLKSAHTDNKEVWPGGSDFRIRDDFGHMNRLNWEQRPIGSAKSLGLKICMAKDVFRFFEPLELDIELSIRTGKAKTVRILDRIDPGYEEFELWIEEPTGARRRFRSPRHYCAERAYLTIRKNQPFRRDISIFLERGGYTFRHAGVHQIWARVHLGRRGVVTSNTISIEIKSERHVSKADERVRRLFTEQSSAFLLYHRVDRHGGRGLGRIGEYIKQAGNGEYSVPSMYAYARAVLARNVKARRQTLNRVYDYLRIVADSPLIGERQREIAVSTIDEMSQR